MKRTGCLLLLIAALLLALWVEVYTHNIHLSLPLPQLNLRQMETLATSLNPVKTGQAAPLKAPGAYVVTGKPTLSADFINRVLAFYHSPAAGLGQALYDDGVVYGIDPAFALAMFQHESTFGRYGMAQVTLSLGNMRCLPNYLCMQGYAAFASWQEGFRAWYFLMRDLYVGQWHKMTVAQIVPIYAPASDGNNVAAYIAAVKHDVDMWRKGQVQV